MIRGVRSLRIVGGHGMKINGIWSKVGGQKMKFSVVLAPDDNRAIGTWRGKWAFAPLIFGWKILLAKCQYLQCAYVLSVLYCKKATYTF